MTIAAFEAQATWLPLVVGMHCAAVSSDGASMLSLHFGDISESFDGEIVAEKSISVEGAWRIERGSEIVAGSADPDEERTETLAMLVGASLERFEVVRPGYDLSLYLSDGIVVRCFPVDSMEYADAVEDPEDVEVSWWVTGKDIADDWETGRIVTG
jgi:hypothetical protein